MKTGQLDKLRTGSPLTSRQRRNGSADYRGQDAGQGRWHKLDVGATHPKLPSRTCDRLTVAKPHIWSAVSPLRLRFWGGAGNAKTPAGKLLSWGVYDLPQGRTLPPHQGRGSALVRHAAPPPRLPSRPAPLHDHQHPSPPAPWELTPRPEKRHFDALTFPGRTCDHRHYSGYPACFLRKPRIFTIWTILKLTRRYNFKLRHCDFPPQDDELSTPPRSSMGGRLSKSRGQW